MSLGTRICFMLCSVTVSVEETEMKTNLVSPERGLWGSSRFHKSWNGRQVGAPLFFLAIIMAVALEIAGSAHWAGIIWGEGISSCCLDLARELRNDYPLVVIPPRLSCSCCLGQRSPCCCNFCFKWPLRNLVSLFPLQVLQAAWTTPPLHNHLILCLINCK